MKGEIRFPTIQSEHIFREVDLFLGTKMGNPYHEWLQELIGYAEDIADTRKIKGAWLSGDTSETSIISPGELISQLFDGLRIQDIKHGTEKLVTENRQLISFISIFIKDAEDLRDYIINGSFELEGKQVLRSRQWASIKSSAEKLLASFAEVSDER